MTKINLIPIMDVCKFNEVELNFINELQNAGLIEIKKVDTQNYISEFDLIKIEKAIRLNMELEINIAGIEAIYHLLERIEAMQSEIIYLKNRRIFETGN